jgi:hypothetical protein
MNFQEAKSYVLRFGKYRDYTLDEVATTTRGLLYLDWLRGELEKTEADRTRLTYRAVCAYLDDPTIQKELGEAMLRKNGA